MSTENSKTNEPHKFRITLTDKLNLTYPNKNMVLTNLSIYYTLKNIKSGYKNNKFKISAPTGMMNLICLMNCIIFHTIKIILSILLKT